LQSANQSRDSRETLLAGAALDSPRATQYSPIKFQGARTMATRSDGRPTEVKLDPTALFLEEVFTDRRVGTIRRFTPVTKEGASDASRPIVYLGETQVMSNVGALPIAFEIEATSLEEAATKFGSLAKESIERTMRELQDLRRQAASSIVIPQAGALPGGGGKIQLP
jgi:hypothetical protein